MHCTHDAAAMLSEWKNVYLFLPIGNETPSCYSGKTIFLPFISHLKYEPYHWNEWAL